MDKKITRALIIFFIIMFLITTFAAARTLIQSRQLDPNYKGGNLTNATVLSSALTIGIEMDSVTDVSIVYHNSSSGTLNNQSYYYRIVALDQDGGETTLSGVVNQTIKIITNNTNNLSWSAVNGALAYRVYNSSSETNFESYFEVSDTNFTHTNQAVTAEKSAPTINGAYVVKLNKTGSMWLRGIGLLVNGNLVQTLGGIWQLTNFTSAYNNRGDRFGESNFTIQYDAQGYKVANFTSDVSSYDTFYKTGNVTTDFPNLDQSYVDDFSYAQNHSTVPIAVQFDGVISFKSDVLFFDNVTLVDLGRINGSLFPAIDATFDLGNSSLRYRSSNFSGEIGAGSMSMTGNLKVGGSISDVTGSTTLSGALTSKALTTLADVTVTAQHKTSSFINQTLNGTIRYFFNGCSELVNDSGVHIIC